MLPASRFDDAFEVNGFPIVEFDRRLIDKDLLRGFVIGWSADLTLIQLIDGHQYLLNGYSVFRNADVKLWRPVSKDKFLARAAVANGLRPQAPPGIFYTSIREAVASAGAALPLVTIHQEKRYKNSCRVGRLLRTNLRSAYLLDISPGAEWESEERYPLKEITLLQFGGTYERLLASMAATHP